MTAELTERVRASVELEDVDVGGVGGTLAGNALSHGRGARHPDRGAHAGRVRGT